MSETIQDIKNSHLHQLMSDLQLLESHLPDKAAQYADEELRPMYAAIQVMLEHTQMYQQMIIQCREQNEASKARDWHVGGSDYSRHSVQPYHVWELYGLNPWDADIIKRVLRTKTDTDMSSKDHRINEYKKIQHIAQTRIEQIQIGDPWYNNVKIPSWVEGETDEGFESSNE